jgi:Mrp family chromosome partitioning ATPase
MDNILNKSGLLRLEILQNKWVILGAAIGIAVIVIAALVLALKKLKKRKSSKAVSINLANSKEPPDKWSQENYQRIGEQIKRAGKRYKSILFVSVGPETLPVTIPVNTAIGLAKNSKRCLLIDLDLKRDAVAAAFGLCGRENSPRLGAVQTEFENLWVWPGRNFAQSKQMNIKQIVQKALSRFDFILINAPSLVSSPDRRQIISAGQAAFICTKDASEATKLSELIKPSDCTVIGHIQVPL